MLRTEVSLRATASDLAARWRHPQTTVRWRLTLLYGGLFLACGVALLAITYTLVDHASITAGPAHAIAHAIEIHRVPAQIRAALSSRAGHGAIHFVVDRQRIADLHQLVIESGIALAIMAIFSTLLGWLVAGRVLAPLRTITATTQEISEANLHQRLALGGPRDELRQLAETIDGLLERLESAFDAQRRFVANASHELRTPLTMMRATLDVAIAKPEGVPPQTRALDADLRLDLDDADRLLESFLMLARAQHGVLGEQSSVALEPIVTAALAARTDQIAAKQIEVHTAAQPIRVAGSETLLERMVENVIENAVRHNQPHGFIEVALALDEDKARLIVDSGGPVLDERAVAQLAQPFRRLTAERTHSQNGHGLGLSIVAGIAAAHGGTLELHARPQGGLRVQITLPGATLAQPVRVR